MDAFRCPRCGTDNYPGLMGFPRCHKCHELLRQCRYCLSQQNGLCRHEGPLPPLQEDDGKPYCDAFASRLTLPGGAPLSRPLTGRDRLLAIAGALIVLMLVTLALTIADEPSPPRLTADVTTVRVIDQLAVVSLLLSAEAVADTVVLRIDPAVLAHYDLVECEPSPLDELPGDGLRLSFAVAENWPLRLRLTLRDQGTPAPELTARFELLDLGGELLDTARVLLLNSRRGQATPPDGQPDPAPAAME